MTESPGVDPLDRPDLYVVARFLDQLREPDTTYTRSQLQMAVRLNWDLFKRYLHFLEGRGFLVVRPNPDGQEIVRLTKEGRDAHDQLVTWIRDVVGDDHL